MTPIHADRPYALQPRYVNKRSGKPLTGFALDITIRFNTDGTPFLQDLNSDSNVIPHTNVDDLMKTLNDEIRHNYTKRYGKAA